ncbi:MAG: ribosome small subunit-dependent GTPase A [Acidimicrobiia bacterium]|nr:ribosome small subunit-dependent GTPase A [Acidimicrobiia bacterium]
MLDEYGWTPGVADRLRGVLEQHTYPGRVARVDRGSCLVVTESGAVDAAAASALDGGGVAVGDWVALRGDDRAGRMIVATAERTSAIVRRDPSPSDNRDQVLAANLDHAFILYRLDRKLRMSVLERYLVLIWDSGAAPVVVLSKADLVGPDERDATVREVERSAAGVPVVAVSAVTGAGMEGLSQFTPPASAVALVGESGVGKSTLVNRLAGAELLDTGPTRAGDGKGRHTTTHREMIPIGDGAVLIDTPGLRSVGLAESGEGIGNVFGDVEELFEYCKFRDCAHESEPGCAVQSAISHGVLDRRRLESYQKLLREQERIAQRKAAIAKRAERPRRR